MTFCCSEEHLEADLGSDSLPEDCIEAKAWSLLLLGLETGADIAGRLTRVLFLVGLLKDSKKGLKNCSYIF